LTAPVRATPEQAENVFELWISAKDAFQLHESYSDPSNRRKNIDWLQEEAAAGRVWIVEEDNKITGLAIIHSDKPEIWYLVVRQGYRGLGIGASIVRHLQSDVADDQLNAESRTPEAKALFEKCGFRQTGESREGFPILTWTKSNV